MKFNDFPEVFKMFFNQNKQPWETPCNHILSSKMADGRYFCPVCGKVENYPLKKGDK